MNDMNEPLENLIMSRLKQTGQLYAMIFIPMWLMFALNKTILFGTWNAFGIEPRVISFGNLIGIVASWTMHVNLAHIMGNTIVMAQILFLFGIFERNAFRTISLLIVGSGLLTWLMGGLFSSTHSIHIGASGLAFAMMGYMIGGALFARRWGYLVACIFLGTGFWLAMLQGLIPQMGVSFAGHFGGLLTGLAYGADSERKGRISKRIGY